MPRQSIASTPASRSVQSSARGAPKAVASPPGLKSVLADTRAQLDTKQTCPLCIEELDDTDRDFFPCPCGYQICLFCYGQVKEKCNSQCPGCRRQYGEPVEGPVLRQHVDDTARSAAAALRSGAAALQTKAGGGALLTKPKGTHDMMGARGGRGGDDTTPLPSGATWASHSARQQAASHPTPTQPSAPPPVDQSAWPSLSDSTATSMSRRVTRHESPHMTNLAHSLADAASDSEGSRCRSSSPSSADLTPLESHSSSSQDLSQDQAALMDVCAAAAVLSTPMASARIPAAVRPLPAGKAPPPGFANVAPRTQPAPVTTPVASACLTHQDPSIAGPPLGRCQPIQPPFHHTSMQQQQQQQHTGYSLWSGLPGFEINLGQLFGGVHMLSAYSCNVPGPYPMAGCFSAKTTPPPGFGPVPYAGPADYGAQRMYQMFGAGGNQFMGMARPSGMAV